MPTYEYACTSCGNRIEVHQSFTDDPLEKCDVCGGQLRRVFHPVGVMFKGSGFYSTDSKSKKKDSTSSQGDKVNDAAASKGTEGPGKSESKSESKPASTTKSEKSA